MTEAEWLGGESVERMLHFACLHFSNPRVVGDRKLRLFAVACCRLIAHALTDERSRSAVEVAERAAEGAAGSDELRAAYADAFAGAAAFGPRSKTAGAPYHVAQYAAEANAIDAAKRTAAWIGAALTTAEAPPMTHWPDDFDGQFNVLRGLTRDAAWTARVAAAREMVPKFLRDVCGNPFRPVTVEPAWLEWNDGTPRKMAQAVYEEQAFHRLPLLADALEDAGCTNEEILAHCREPGGIHVRGCWVIDLLLGKG